MPKFIALKSFTYNGKALVPGQVFDREGARWDERLLEKRYVYRFEGQEKSLVKCADCGREFESQSVCDSHMYMHIPEPKVAPIQKLEDLHPDGLTLKYGEPIPADVALS